MNNKCFLVTADDVGILKSIDKAVQELIVKGIINNISIFINSNSDKTWIKEFSEDINLSLHLTFSNGNPLTDIKLVPSLVDDNGYFRKPFKPNTGDSEEINKSIQDFLAYVEENACEKELELECLAQFNKFYDVFGRKPDFINVHHDLDKSPKIYRIIKKCCPTYQTRKMLLDTKTWRACLYRFLSDDLDIERAIKEISMMVSKAHTMEKESGMPVEVIFHPAFYSSELQRFSAYAAAREIEYAVLVTMAERHLL